MGTIMGWGGVGILSAELNFSTKSLKFRNLKTSGWVISFLCVCFLRYDFEKKVNKI